MLNDFPLKWDKFIVNFIDKGGYKQVLAGLENTITVAVLGLIIGMVIGCIIAIICVMPKYPVLPHRMQNAYDRFLGMFPKNVLLRIVTFYYLFYVIMWVLQRIPKVLQKICSLYVALFRGTPVMVQLLLGYFVLFPAITGAIKAAFPELEPAIKEFFPKFQLNVTAVNASILIFGLNSGAYVSEIMRGGINSVDPGQLEAARAVGFSYASSMLRIVVPQAIKNILPTLGNEFIALIKETSIIGYAGALDLVFAFKQIGTSTYEYTVPYIVLSVIYIALVVVITVALKIMERWLSRSDRRH